MALFGPCVLCDVITFHRTNYGYKKEFVCGQCMEGVESSWGSDASSAWWSTSAHLTDDGEADSDEPES